MASLGEVEPGEAKDITTIAKDLRDGIIDMAPTKAFFEKLGPVVIQAARLLSIVQGPEAAAILDTLQTVLVG